MPNPDPSRAALADKLCRGCHVMKPLDQFNAWRCGKGDKLEIQSRCRDCLRQQYQSAEYKEKHTARMAVRRTEGKRKEIDKRHSLKRKAQYPEKTAAKDAVRRALESGRLMRPSICEACHQSPQRMRNGAASIQAHHDDYSKPLEVRWLCIACHVLHHRRAA